jgi:alkanesulfonate monooxygenase SsuD/methylene tetrahydromethanopterin reductase-like flavin-dependent oxidoreductase (luciferase family)
MKIGIGLPNTIVGVDRTGIVDWAKQAEEAGFSSLGTIDRLAYPNFESITCLAAAAAVTEKIELVTDILLAPLRSNTALLAKQAATLDQISNGRLVLGLAPGGREPDYEVSEIDFGGRGKVFDRQLQELGEFWKGKGGVGPAPANGEKATVLIGGSNQKALKRAARHADGWTMGGGAPDAFKETLPKLKEAWEAEGREGEPRTMALCYFALGDNGKEAAQQDLGEYYEWLGKDIAQSIVDSAVINAEMAKGYIGAFEEAGADELIFFPASSDIEQVQMLAEAAL